MISLLDSLIAPRFSEFFRNVRVFADLLEVESGPLQLTCRACKGYLLSPKGTLSRLNLRAPSGTSNATSQTSRLPVIHGKRVPL